MTEDSMYFYFGARRLRKYEEQVKNGETVLVETKEWSRYKKEKTIAGYLKKRNIVLGDYYSLDQYKGKDEVGNIPRLRRMIEGFDKKFRSASLYLYSSKNSTQKTTTAKIVARELALRGYSVFFILMDDLVKRLTKDGFEEKNAELIETVRECDFLIIDDCFDPTKMTVYRSGYQLSFLDSFLRYRMETAKKATCFTSNIAPEKIEDKFDRHIAALVSRNAYPMEFDDSIYDFDISKIWD